MPPADDKCKARADLAVLLEIHMNATGVLRNAIKEYRKTGAWLDEAGGALDVLEKHTAPITWQKDPLKEQEDGTNG